MNHFSSIALIVLSVGCRSEKVINTYNAAPTALITSHQDGDTVYEGFAVEVRGQVTDSNHNAELLQTAWFYEDEELCGWAPPDAGGGTFCDFIPTVGDNTIRLEVRDPQGSGGVNAITLSVEATEAPSAEILSPSDNDTFYADQKVLFVGQISDLEDAVDSLTVTWTSDIDGTLDSELTINSSGEISTAEYLSVGQHIVQLTVTDSTGKDDSDTISILVGEANSEPLCSIIAPQNNTVSLLNDEVLFEGSATDVDSNPSSLTVVWSSDKDGEIGTSVPTGSGNVTLSYRDLSPNSHVITMTATDERGLSCSDSIVFRVGTPPTINIVSPTSNQGFLESEAVTFELVVSDFEDQPDDVALNWTLDGQPYTTFSADSTGIAQFSDTGLGFGNHILSVTATDTDGMTDTDQVSFSINGAPSSPVIEISPSNPTTLDDLSLIISQPSIDPEGYAVSYNYAWTKNGVPQTNEISDTLSSTLTNKNELWTLSVTPSDGQINGTPATASVTIQNSAPSITDLVIQHTGSIYNDSILTCVATVVDPDDSVVPVYTWNLNGQTYTGNTVNLSNFVLSGGDTISCTATADDGTAVSVSQSTSSTIDNRAPVVTLVNVFPTTLYSNSTASCTVQSSDADGDSLSTLLTWYAGGQIIGTGSSLTLTGLVYPTDVLNCEATVDDGIDSAIGTSIPITIQNTAPTTPSVTVSSSNGGGSPAAETDDLYCTVSVSSTDIDGDPILYNFYWTGPNGENVVHSNQSGPIDTLFANTPTTEGLWVCSVEATDGLDASSTATGTIYVETGCPPEGTGADSTCPSTDCLSILEDGHAETGDDGVYWIDPDGTGAYQAYCDMTTDDGGWTMCYTENGNMVHIQSETSYTGGYGQAGYRTDCSEIAFTDVLYINHNNGQQAWFYAQNNTPMTISNLGYNASGATAGTLFTGGGVASTTWNYQLNVCDSNWMWVGLMMTGYTNCYKQCGSWCGDTSSPYFRTDGDNGGNYNGVSFNQNGHTNVGYKTMSVGIR